MSDIKAQTEALAAQMKQKLGIRGRDFPAAVARARHRWPRGVHRHAERLAEALPHADHPRLALTLDRDGLDRSAQIVRDHLDAIDLAERRKDLWLGIAASIALGLIVIFAAAVTVLVWRGIL
jgi:hypothetical protein